MSTPGYLNHSCENNQSNKSLCENPDRTRPDQILLSILTTGRYYDYCWDSFLAEAQAKPQSYFSIASRVHNIRESLYYELLIASPVQSVIKSYISSISTTTYVVVSIFSSLVAPVSFLPEYHYKYSNCLHVRTYRS